MHLLKDYYNFISFFLLNCPNFIDDVIRFYKAFLNLVTLLICNQRRTVYM